MDTENMIESTTIATNEVIFHDIEIQTYQLIYGKLSN